MVYLGKDTDESKDIIDSMNYCIVVMQRFIKSYFISFLNFSVALHCGKSLYSYSSVSGRDEGRQTSNKRLGLSGSHSSLGCFSRRLEALNSTRDEINNFCT